MPLLLALLASVCFAAAYVLQYHEAHEAPARLFLSPRLLLELARHPIWVAGIVAMTIGNLLQAAAIGSGSLAVIEPVLTTSLLFALPLSAAWRRERLGGRDWLGALMVSGGLGALLGVGSPGNGHSDMSVQAWTLVTLSTWGLALTLVAAGRRTSVPSAKAALLGGGASVLFGLQDALTRYCLATWKTGFQHLLVAWQPYVLIVTGIYGLTLMQSAYEAGPLPASLPALAVGEPVVGMLIGVLALGERLDTSGVDPLWEALGALVMIGGVWLLARSPLVLGRMHPRREPAPPVEEQAPT